MNAERFETASEEETIALGERLAARLPEGSVVLLTGNLGAGKTTLAKGILQGWIHLPAEEISSPTFTLIHEYAEGVYHIDLYRLDTRAEVETLGLDDIFDHARLVLIEWGERFPELMPANSVRIELESAGQDRRAIQVTALRPAAPDQARETGK
ncbi:MAG: tRNA (adenosine(37)-N6)-threonylcarbamoyltransferase complex ATPase subunit type 1 TsaE [Bryobacteraceae bacterium]|nr:tRNA (adenosine(37)-N6)-threonylcarbamoyltransferase complex ATPase subunit type 1 TsaE [Bryobacteraceae bacterium]